MRALIASGPTRVSKSRPPSPVTLRSEIEAVKVSVTSALAWASTRIGSTPDAVSPVG